MATVFKNVVNDFIWPFQVNIHQFSPCIMESLYEFYEKKIPNIFRSINIQINLITYVWKKTHFLRNIDISLFRKRKIYIENHHN